jgi:ribose transport system permease protein
MADRRRIRSLLSLAAAMRLLRTYTFGFALLLAVVLLIADLLATKSFGWTQQLATFAPLAIAAMAQTPSILSGRGGFDLTISPLMTLVSIVFVVWLVPAGLGGAASVPLVLLFGAAIGALNGLIIVGLRVPAMVVTLATYFMVVGIDLKLAQRPATLSDSWVTSLTGRIGPVPGGLLLIAAPVVIWILLGRFPYRRTLYLVGSSDATAFSSGIKVGLVRVSAYALGGLFAGIGGLALTALVSSGDAGTASSYTLIAVAAVALGGTPLTGGRGGVVGSLIGAACIYLLQSLLQASQINTTWLQLTYGLMLIFAVVFGATLSKPKGVGR